MLTSADDGDLSAGLDGWLWLTAGWAARVCDRVYEVVAGVAHHEAGRVETTVVDEDGSEPAVADEHECVHGFVEACVAASGGGCFDGFGGAPGGFERTVRGEAFVPAVAGVLFDRREIRLVEVGVTGHWSKEPRVVVRRRLSASGCLGGCIYAGQCCHWARRYILVRRPSVSTFEGDGRSGECRRVSKGRRWLTTRSNA